MFAACAAVTVVQHAVADEALNERRLLYAEALRAIDRDNWADYAQLRQGLEDYPLAIYLDYFALTAQQDAITPEEAARFLARSDDSPLNNRLLAIYLRQAGESGRWQDFLQAMPSEPNSADLKCYYFRAQLAQGNKSLAWQGAGQLWSQGRSQPPACDPLFTAWESAGGLTDAIVWTRLLNAFAARESSLLTYVAKKGSAAAQPQIQTLLAVYKNPDTLLQQRFPPDDPRSADIASYGLAHLARYSPQEALTAWIALQQRLVFDAQQTQRAEYAITRQSLFAQLDDNSEWLHGALARLGDDELVGIRLRWALQAQDWGALQRTLPLLSESGREDNAWRYWQTVVQEHSGQTSAAQAGLKALASERDYYGFLAADKLGKPYAFNQQQLVPPERSTVDNLSAVRRIEELKFHNEDALAHAEWYKLLQDTDSQTQQQELALLASQRGWYRMSIDAATRAQAWDALDQRFPTPYRDVFQKNALAQRVPPTELMSIARRESAFFPGAQSPVGARGLMQIMPATGKQVASSVGRAHSVSDLYDVEHNVQLGSTYYRQLLDRFDGNRVFALTAYNAGPHRVDRWRRKGGETVPVEVWIETIPYRETRNYVQAVLAYNVVFQYLLGESQKLLTPLEQEASY
jgi:soluble lytic murein transglycosylase